MNTNIKILEIRDRATFIPVIAIRLDENFQEDELRLMKFVGYGIDDKSHNNYTILIKLSDVNSTNYDPYEWGDRTMLHSHKYIHENWKDLKTRDVIDVEYILGESSTKKTSQVK